MTNTRDTDPPESWDEKTDPDSLAGLRKTIRENTRVCNAALEWSVKTYELVKSPLGAFELSQGVRRATGLAVAAALVSLVTFVTVACELLSR